MQPFDVNGSWLVGRCTNPVCREVRMVRSGTAAPQVAREWCHACGSYAIKWGWIRIEDATVTDGDAAPVKH